ncbi:aminotransferase class I/II-fold pyridoxal phosphate-dependent enzyme [Corallococcus sp. M34]|uniref:aminotransferase class I/II-fold pyridoxal phosphate-dependent enzyme n=1 Tax=Citreicoccus inhibens TaxID=2849499 RepID=UPI001C21403F|nr:aminotransferase class I/II-fold pyridoxal phosphate-dependent enzyme [Citreicoccus inhibens]MBU8898664.1 aminotransferase class I/II-fold pyridoxal phosphate-dependent enzyme [Citreicoccus inhibens]
MEERRRYRNGEAMVALGNPSFEAARRHGVIDLSVHHLGGGRLGLEDGREFLNLSSCSYLGLDAHPAVLDGAIEALQQEKLIDTGISRVRVRLSLLDALEQELGALWRTRAITAVSASAATAGLLPLVAGGQLCDDGQPRVMVFDKSCHFSMNLIKPICADEAPVLTCPHNDLNFLEDVCRKHPRVAYVADGFYSMGGAALVKDLLALQERYGLYLYFDDSHGLSVHGEHGEGFVRSLLGEEIHPLTLVVASLAKGFGTSGGVVMLGARHLEDRVHRFGGPLAWSQGLNVASIGAGLASAKLHRTPELGRLQGALRANLQRFDAQVEAPNRGSLSQIRVVEVGAEEQAVERSRHMLDKGFYTSAVFFPIVARGRAGLRVMLRANLSDDDMNRLCNAVRAVAGKAA